MSSSIADTSTPGGPHVGVDLERRWSVRHPEDHGRWWVWLTDTLGTNPATMLITDVWLGEGSITLRRRHDHSLECYETDHPAPVPPPCWPHWSDA